MEKKMKEFLVNSVFFGAIVSLAAYEAGLLLKKHFKLAVFNPLLIATVAEIGRASCRERVLLIV